MVASLTLHVSLPCSGASQLQGILSRGRAALREQGIWYPGEGYLPRDGLNQQAIGDARDQAVRHAETTRAEIAGHPGHVIVSADSLAHLDATGVEEVLALLGARPDTVRVVITALDLGRLLPALWTNTVENGFTTHFEPFLMAAVDRRRDDGEPWRTALDLPALVSRWQAAVGADRVTLVPVPPETTGPGLLWTRFAEAAGLEPRPPAPLPFGRATDDGTRLSAGQAQMLRALNSVMLGLPSPTQRELRERVLAAWGASGASGTSGESSGPRLVLPDSFRGRSGSGPPRTSPGFGRSTPACAAGSPISTRSSAPRPARWPNRSATPSPATSWPFSPPSAARRPPSTPGSPGPGPVPPNKRPGRGGRPADREEPDPWRISKVVE